MVSISKSCKVDDCDRPVHGHGYCDPHSKRLLKYGDALYGGRLKIKDGRMKDPVYSRWANMIQRCTNPNASEYHRYGGRGIRVHTDWLTDFAVFKRDMGPLPSPSHQLDRKDNDKDYTPDNCRWSTQSVNCFNRPSSRPSITGFLNVSIHKTHPRVVYRVYLKYQQQRIHVGLYYDATEAAWMADQYRLALWGEGAKLNFDYHAVAA